jgi:hypothetical protein
VQDNYPFNAYLEKVDEPGRPERRGGRGYFLVGFPLLGQPSVVFFYIEKTCSFCSLQIFFSKTKEGFCWRFIFLPWHKENIPYLDRAATRGEKTVRKLIGFL